MNSTDELPLDAAQALGAFSFNAAVTLEDYPPQLLADIVQLATRYAQRRNIFSLEAVHKLVKKELGLDYKGKRNYAKMFTECAFLRAAKRFNVREVRLFANVSELVEMYPNLKTRCTSELEKLLE